MNALEETPWKLDMIDPQSGSRIGPSTWEADVGEFVLEYGEVVPLMLHRGRATTLLFPSLFFPSLLYAL